MVYFILWFITINKFENKNIHLREREGGLNLSYAQSVTLANGMHWLTAMEIEMNNIIFSSLNFCHIKTGNLTISVFKVAW